MAIHRAIARNNSLKIIELLLDHGAHPTGREDEDDVSAVARAARRGRGDLLALFAERGFRIALDGVDRLIAACAMDDAATIRDVRAREPNLVRELLQQGPTLLSDFAGTWNTAGGRQPLDLGVPPGGGGRGGGGF